MGPKTTRLCELLRETSAILKRASQSRWAEWMDESLRLIENGNISGVEHLVSAYGGMGSFNEVILMAGDNSMDPEESWVSENERFARLQSGIYDLACEVLRNAEFVD